MELLEEIGRYKKLCDDGIITPERFEIEKERLKKEINKNRLLQNSVVVESNYTQKNYNKYVEEVLDDYSSSYSSKVAQLKALLKKHKITKEEYNKALDRLDR